MTGLYRQKRPIGANYMYTRQCNLFTQRERKVRNVYQCLSLCKGERYADEEHTSFISVPTVLLHTLNKLMCQIYRLLCCLENNSQSSHHYFDLVNLTTVATVYACIGVLTSSDG